MTCTITLTLGQRIRIAREKAGLEQADLEIATMTTRQAISAWENDRHRPHLLKLRAIAQVCNVPIEFFNGNEMTFATIPDGGAPLAVTAGVTDEYDRAPQVSTLRLAA
jgi:transcriptional regulator with XRE-family HTH domain